MRWEMEAGEIETALERIWDLHDKVSGTIHAVSRGHFLRSVRALGLPRSRRDTGRETGNGDGGGGFVFVKGFGPASAGVGEEEGEGEEDVIAEARSLNAIRNALENMEDQLELFHAMKLQQQVERDTAIARLEQSRLVLSLRLTDHRGKKYKVIDEALAFVGDMSDARRFISSEILFEKSRSCSYANLGARTGKKSNALIQMLLSGMEMAKKSIGFGISSGILGNTALFAMSMLALYQVHQVAFRRGFLLDPTPMNNQRSSNYSAGSYESPVERSDRTAQVNQLKHLDVFLARG